jgi:hypothetical protein
VGALPDNLLEDMSNELGENSSNSSHCGLASLVNMVPSMMHLKVGCCRAEMSQAAVSSAIYSRCITDLDTNCTTTVVEEDDYHSPHNNGLSSPRKRPISTVFGQDGADSACNLMLLTTSPKRVKL